jgi:hypothetical protein
MDGPEKRGVVQLVAQSSLFRVAISAKDLGDDASGGTISSGGGARLSVKTPLEIPPPRADH